jgi:hypothetical protein
MADAQPEREPIADPKVGARVRSVTAGDPGPSDISHQLAAGRAGKLAGARSPADAALADYSAACRAMGVASMAESPLVRLFGGVLDRVDYWLTQTRLRLVDAVCGPEP